MPVIVTLLIVALYLGVCWAAGVAFTFISSMPWQLEHRLSMGVPVGWAAAALVTWLTAIPLGMSTVPVLLGAAILLLLAAVTARLTGAMPRFALEYASARVRWRTREPLPFVILVAVGALFLVPFFAHALVFSPSGLYAGHALIYGDWAGHLGLAANFMNAQQLLPPNNPWFSGINLAYSFLPDFFAAMLADLGLHPADALSLSSAVLSVALLACFYGAAVRFIRNGWGALVAALLVFVGGGFGAGLFLSDVSHLGLANVLLSPPREYTWLPDLGQWWRTPLLSQVVPQRNVDFGWPLGLLALQLLWFGWTRRLRREMVLAGIVVGLMPLFHANSWADLGVISAGLALLSWRRVKDWLGFFIPAAGLGFPQALMLLPPPELRHPFFHIQWGWMATTLGRNDNIVWFWFANTLFFIPLAVLAWAVGPRRVRKFLLPSWILFLVSNVVVLQTWDWDNTKWMIWWFIPASMLCGWLLVRIAQLRLVLVPVVVVIVGVQIAGGLLDLDHAWQERLNAPQLQMLDADEVALADWARTGTPVDSVFLTSFQHNHPIRTLGGRPAVMGGLVSLWTTDIDYRAREQDCYAMFAGAANTDILLQQYNVRYVVIGPGELRDLHANTQFFSRRFPRAYQSPTGEYKVFKVG